MKALTKQIQTAVGVTPDGVYGPKTAAAIADRLGLPVWPSQAEVRSGSSIFGRAGDESNLVSVIPPYQLYFGDTPLKTIRVHRLIADPVRRALQKIKDSYTPAELHELKLDRFDGCFNDRSTRSGSSKSLHAWGIALDFAAAGNGMNDHSPKAPLSHPSCRHFWEAWESVGAVSLGRERDYDWMHVQFATL